ncbi:hypothetical protein IE077_002615, partial [Cardiosporidium cionae]
MEQLLLKETDPEALLTLMVTHRGVFFVQNLVTLLRMLAEIAEGDAVNKLVAKDLLTLQNNEPEFSTSLLSKVNSLPYTVPNKPYEGFSEMYREIPAITEMWKEDLAGIHHGRSMAEWIIRDERYDLLLQDLHKYRSYLDFESLAVVVTSLRILQHKHFQILSAYIRPLLEKSSQLIDFSKDEMEQQFDVVEESNTSKNGLYNRKDLFDLLIKCAEVYLWAGYIQIPFYDRCASLLIREFKKLEVEMDTGLCADKMSGVVSLSAVCNTLRPSENVENVDTSSIMTVALSSSFYPKLLVNAANLFGSLEIFNRSFFETCEKMISFYASDYRNSGNPFSYFTPSDFTSIAKAITAHSLYTFYGDSVLTLIADILVSHSGNFEINEIAACICSFRRVALKFPRAIVVLCDRLYPYVMTAFNLRQKCSALTPDNLCEILEACTYFGRISTVDMRMNLVEDPVSALCGAILLYLEDYIDEISEKSATQAVFAMSAIGLADQHTYLLSFLYRKIGYGKEWESLKVTLFQIWMCHILQFPWLPHNMPLRCVNEGTYLERGSEVSNAILSTFISGLRAWCLQRGGYGAPFPQEVFEISNILKQQNIEHCLNEQIDGPYELDIVLKGEDLDRKVLLVVAQCSHNSLEPCGGALLQVQHLKQFGYIAFAIQRSYWR